MIKLLMIFSFFASHIQVFIFPVTMGSHYKIFGSAYDINYQNPGCHFIVYRRGFMVLLGFCWMKRWKSERFSRFQVGFRLTPSYRRLTRPKLIGLGVSIKLYSKPGALD